MTQSDHHKECDPRSAATDAGQETTCVTSTKSNESALGINRRLVDSDVAAPYLGIGKRKLWQLTACGAIAHIRIGRAVRYDFRDLDLFIAKHRKGGPKR